MTSGINFCVVDYADLKLPGAKEMEMLSDLQYSHGDLVITPTFSKITRELVSDQLLKTFIQLTNDFDEKILHMLADSRKISPNNTYFKAMALTTSCAAITEKFQWPVVPLTKGKQPLFIAFQINGGQPYDRLRSQRVLGKQFMEGIFNLLPINISVTTDTDQQLRRMQQQTIRRPICFI